MSVISRPTPLSTLPSPSLMGLTLIDFEVAMSAAWTELDPAHHVHCSEEQDWEFLEDNYGCLFVILPEGWKHPQIFFFSCYLPEGWK